MRSEIGSEFWNIPQGDKNNLFSNDTEWFISGRSALVAILSENSFKTASIPAWCCDSMIKPFVDFGIRVEFYYDEPTATDVALVMDYFGYTTEKTYDNFSGIVIRDTTHSLFSKQYDDADYYFGSLRKWAGFWTGGYAWGFKNPIKFSSDTASYVELRKKAMAMKAEYINGNTDDKSYLKVFEAAETQLEEIGILPAAERDIKAANNLDVVVIKEKRRRNAKILLDEFSKYAIYPELGESDCPMFVPIRMKNRDALRAALIENDVYCPVHWPVSKYHDISKPEQGFYEEELSLVCDQRYSENDMHRIVAVINQFLGR